MKHIYIVCLCILLCACEKKQQVNITTDSSETTTTTTTAQDNNTIHGNGYFCTLSGAWEQTSNGELCCNTGYGAGKIQTFKLVAKRSGNLSFEYAVRQDYDQSYILSSGAYNFTYFRASIGDFHSATDANVIVYVNYFRSIDWQQSPAKYVRLGETVLISGYNCRVRNIALQ